MSRIGTFILRGNPKMDAFETPSYGDAAFLYEHQADPEKQLSASV
jgi:hypothetical protein